MQKYAARDDLPLLEAARLGMLPDQLKAWHIAWLYFSEKADEPRRKIFCNALNEAATKGDLKAELRSMQRPVRIAMKFNGRPVDPDARDEYETLHYYVVNRDDYKAFLQANGEWPPAPDALIARWYETEMPKQDLVSAPLKKNPVPRINALHQLIEKVFLALYTKTKIMPHAKEVFRELEQNTDTYDTGDIIQEIVEDVIYWRSSHGAAPKMAMKAFRNRVSIIRRKYEKQKVKRKIPA